MGRNAGPSNPRPPRRGWKPPARSTAGGHPHPQPRSAPACPAGCTERRCRYSCVAPKRAIVTCIGAGYPKLSIRAFSRIITAGQNNWYCTVAGSPGTWVIGVGPVAVGASLPATCAVGQQYFVTTSGATYGLNVCIATNTWTAQSGASDSGTVTSVSASCAHGPNAVDDAHVPMTWGKSVSSPRQWPRLASLWRSRLDTLATVSRAT